MGLAVGERGGVMNKQEAIEKVTERMKQLNMGGAIWVMKDDVIEIISQVHEPQKMTVPKFVAEWIETHKRCMPFLSHLFTDNLDEELKGWLDFSDNQNLMAKAWLYGYEVEKKLRKLYKKLDTKNFPN
jgi:hypothetical protein